MRRNGYQRGEGRVGLVIALIVLGVAIFAGTKFVPVYVAAYDLKDTIRREAQGAALKTDEQIRKTILAKGAELDLPIGRDNIEASRSNTKFTLRVRFTKDLDMALFIYKFRFDERESAPLF